VSDFVNKLKDLHTTPRRASWKYREPTDKQVATISRLAPRLDITGLDRGACCLLLTTLIATAKEAWAHSFPDTDALED
jgi:hypothetical protein